VAAILVCYLPYLGAGWGMFGFLTGYVSEEGLATGSGIWLAALTQALLGNVPGLTAVYVAAAAAIMGWLGLRVAFGAQRTPRQSIADIVPLLTAGLFLMSPNYAWYFLALVPFIPLGAGAPTQLPMWALTLGAFLLYRPIYLPHNELIWKTLATIPFLVAAAWVWRHSLRGGH
jgi:alpha-1,6-mannosyltransferase